MFYALHTDKAAFGYPKRYRIHGYTTASERARDVAYYKRSAELFDACVAQYGHCTSSAPTSYESLEPIGADVAHRIMEAAQAAGKFQQYRAVTGSLAYVAYLC